jgi:WD40 repeat protein
MMWDFVKDR